MPESDLRLLIEAAEASGRIARKYFGARPEMWDKGAGQGPVTEADLEIDRMLHNELLAARPDYGWLSEESEDTTDRLHRQNVFIIDPIDGTRAFIAGEKSFAHSLAVAREGEIVAAAVYLPMKDLMYVAARDGGAFLNGAPIAPTHTANMKDARVLATKVTMHAENWPNGVPEFKRFHRPSLAYRLCLVAQGRYDAMVTLRATWEWDVAAGDLIAAEAGAGVTTPQDRLAQYNNPVPQLAGMVAAGVPLHAQLIANLKTR